MTGMPADTRAEITSACSCPPSSLTAWQRVSFRIRAALSTACSKPVEPSGNGRSTTTSARCDGPAYHFGMVDHLIERHRQRGAMPLHGHGHAIADQDGLDAGGVEQPGQHVVVGREHADLATSRLHGDELGDGHPLVGGHTA